MSDKKISELINAEDIDDSDVFPLVQDNITKKSTWTLICNAIRNKFKPYDVESGTLGCKDLGSVSNSDLNDINAGETAYWSYNSGNSNVPCDAGRVYCFKNYSAAKRQVAFHYHNDTIYTRHFYNNAWSSWRSI